jgi:hypothetical protein
MPRYKGPPLLGQDRLTAISRLVVKEAQFNIRLRSDSTTDRDAHGPSGHRRCSSGSRRCGSADGGGLGFLILPVMLRCLAATLDR